MKKPKFKDNDLVITLDGIDCYITGIGRDNKTYSLGINKIFNENELKLIKIKK